MLILLKKLKWIVCVSGKGGPPARQRQRKDVESGDQKLKN
jgi:hypothetical protein